MAYKIIEQKGATFFGISSALLRLTSVIFSDEKSILTPSCMLMGEYGRSGIYTGVPAIVGKEGIYEIVELDLSNKEYEKFNYSCNLLTDLSKASSTHYK